MINILIVMTLIGGDSVVSFLTPSNTTIFKIDGSCNDLVISDNHYHNYLVILVQIIFFLPSYFLSGILGAFFSRAAGTKTIPF